MAAYGPNISADYTVTKTGPLFNGSIHSHMKRGLRAIEDEIGEKGVELIRQRLDEVLVNPTGYYSSRVTSERRKDQVVLTDSDVVYGPWLEGVSERNTTTKFKGYHTFERSMKELDAKVPEIVDRALERFLI